MSSSPLASIVICNYNYDRFLGAAIDSAINQTHPHVEVIVVDDGSTDESREVMARYGDRIIPILKPNEGHDTAVNDGFRASRGDLVCFLDADDALYTTAAARSAEALSAAGVVKVHWPLAIVDGLGRPDGRFLPEGALPSGDLRAEVITHGPQGLPDAAHLRERVGAEFPRTGLPDSAARKPRRHRRRSAVHARAIVRGDRRDRVPGRLSCARQQQLLLGKGAPGAGENGSRLRSLLRHIERRLPASGCCRRSRTMAPRLVAAPPAGAISCIVGVVPEGDSFALAVEGSWGAGEWIDGRRQLQFPNCDGVYWGTPASDEEAIAELERLRRDGAGFLAIGWTAFWYCEYFSAWYRFIRDSFRCLEGRPICTASRPMF